jgi:hypothetical protein
MSVFQPANDIQRVYSGDFDFPRGKIVMPDGTELNPCAPGQVANVPPGDDEKTWLERWYDKEEDGFGMPAVRQGWATIYEEGTAPEEEDPKELPFIDLLLDRDRGIVINHTARLSGKMVNLFKNGNYQFKATIILQPLMGNNGPYQVPYPDWQTITPSPTHIANRWYLLNSTNMVYTLRAVIPHSEAQGDDVDPNYPLSVPGIYRILINWDFRHKEPGEARWHYESLGGFDHNLVFRVGFQTSE